MLDLSGYGLCFHGSNSTADILRVIVLHNLALKATLGSTRNKGTNTHTHKHTGLGNYRLRDLLLVGKANDEKTLVEWTVNWTQHYKSGETRRMTHLEFIYNLL